MKPCIRCDSPPPNQTEWNQDDTEWMDWRPLHEEFAEEAEYWVCPVCQQDLEMRDYGEVSEMCPGGQHRIADGGCGMCTYE